MEISINNIQYGKIRYNIGHVGITGAFHLLLEHLLPAEVYPRMIPLPHHRQVENLKDMDSHQILQHNRLLCLLFFHPSPQVLPQALQVEVVPGTRL